jgi:hypothetical protein
METQFASLGPYQSFVHSCMESIFCVNQLQVSKASTLHVKRASKKVKKQPKLKYGVHSILKKKVFDQHVELT